MRYCRQRLICAEGLDYTPCVPHDHPDAISPYHAQLYQTPRQGVDVRIEFLKIPREMRFHAEVSRLWASVYRGMFTAANQRWVVPVLS